ncbi:hypothetical protein ACTHOQ_05295 [Solibacillus silvestris]|uniref:hypothetical protein n=1 Tax=Solibacillus silvestris TaxID=76853 RepID=UPI003F7D3A3B
MNTFFFLFLLYIVIFLGVKHGINYSHIGQIAKNKFPDDIDSANLNDEEIEHKLPKKPEKPTQS